MSCNVSQYTLDTKPITQKEIAARLGLNNSTVSLALRNSGKISVETRQLVQKTAQELGYRLNATAANLSKYRKNSQSKPVQAALAWFNCWPNPKDLYKAKEFDLYWQGAKETCTDFGYHIEEFAISKDLTPDRVEQIIESRGIKGIFMPPQITNSYTNFSSFGWHNYSVVRFGRSVQNPAAHIVTADQFGNMMLAYDEATKLGYKHIGMANVRRKHAGGVSFDAGYLRAQEIRKQQSRIPIFYDSPDDQTLNQTAFNDWIETYKVDAIITATNGIRDLITNAGYRVGIDIGLAAMSVLDTRITAGIYQHSFEIGRLAARNLIAMVQGNEKGIPKLTQQSLVTGTWVDGDSLPNKSI